MPHLGKPNRDIIFSVMKEVTLQKKRRRREKEKKKVSEFLPPKG